MTSRLFQIGCLTVFLVTILLAGGCRNTASQITIADPRTYTQVKQELPLTVPTDTSDVVYRGLKQKNSVYTYYQTYGSDPVWMVEKSNQADTMLSIIRNAQYYGLSGISYHLRELEMLKQRPSNLSAIRSELLLTDAFLSLAGDLKFGLLNSKGKQKEDTARIQLLNRLVLEGNLKNGLESREPVLNGYKNLKEGLRQLLNSTGKYELHSAFLSAQIRLISINMERWRREVSSYGRRYIFINIPSYTLEVFDHDSVVLFSKVIVGTPETETPVLSSVVECFSIYPYWHVPRKISVGEYLPILKKDATFLRRNNFDVLDRKGKVLNPDSIPWNKFTENYFPVVLRQREGVENSLGVIKFIFDNPYAVFLHDTNAKRLFKSTHRALSHGCIRMEKAVDLAHYLVTGSVNVESKTISKYLKEKQQRWIDLRNPIPILTRYFTCDFTNGELTLYQDVYGKDQQLYELLYQDHEPLEF